MSSEETWRQRGLRDAVVVGDEGAWRTLYEECFEPLYAYAFHRLGRDRERTDEVIQEVWMTAVRRIAQFDPDLGTFDAWLRGITDNVMRNVWRRERQRRQMTSAPVDGAAGSESPFRAVELAEEIALTLTKLPARYQRVLRAKYHDELAVGEIAAQWNETPKAIESLLSRARAAFRQAYETLTRE